MKANNEWKPEEWKIRNLHAIFHPKSIAVIGASREPGKIGHIIVKNFIDGGYAGKIYPINPFANEVLGLKTYSHISEVPGEIDSAIIAIPAALVPQALEECGKRGVKGAVIISGGFGEIGKTKLEQQIASISNKYKIATIGPNCMGVLTPSDRNDSIFLPLYKMGRPKVGDISFISQSGAVGGCIIDLAARAGVGIGKFISYGNAAVINEADLLAYLAHDEKTRVVVAYLEGVREGRAFMQAAKMVTKKKPLIVLKAGKTSAGQAAAKSHTGALAGSPEVYEGVFKQCGITEANTLTELFDFAKIFDIKECGSGKIAVITNGGGSGVLAADHIEEFGLELAEFSTQTKNSLRKILPPYTTVHNPVDLVGDADSSRYEKAIEIAANDPNVDIIIVIVLFQTVGIDARVVPVIVKAAEKSPKPLVVVSTGGEYTEIQRRILDSYGVPTYPSPSSAVRSISKLVKYCNRK